MRVRSSKQLTLKQITFYQQVQQESDEDNEGESVRLLQGETYKGLTISALTCCSSTSGANHASFCALWIRETTKLKLYDKIDLLLNSALAPDNCKLSE